MNCSKAFIKGLMFVVLLLLVSCSKEGFSAAAEPENKSPVPFVKYSKIKPTEKYPHGSVWRVETEVEIWDFPMSLLGQYKRSGFLTIFFTWPEMKRVGSNWPINKQGVRIAFSMPNDNSHYSQSGIDKLLEMNSYNGDFEKIVDDKLSPVLIEYRHSNSSLSYYVPLDPIWKTPKGYQYVISCRGSYSPGVKNSPIYDNRKCSFTLDNGNGVSLVAHFYQYLLTDWPKFLRDIDSLVNSFRRTR